MVTVRGIYFFRQLGSVSASISAALGESLDLRIGNQNPTTPHAKPKQLSRPASDIRRSVRAEQPK
jgi:hypothetical protein